ncbi:Formate dehydrogenase [Venturia nashicola]|nr:Formate dehydrogenase [Venturia nashicola]
MNESFFSLLNYCPSLHVNQTVAGFPITSWSKSLANLRTCDSGAGRGAGFTYFRPDAGKRSRGALQPYVFVIAQILLHFPTCLVRVARWDKIQVFSIVLAVVNIAITIQAYVSTRLVPGQVLVWTPVTLILDAGAMLQIYVLIIEDISFQSFVNTLQQGVIRPFKVIYSRTHARLRQDSEATKDNRPAHEKVVVQHHLEKGDQTGTTTAEYVGVAATEHLHLYSIDFNLGTSGLSSCRSSCQPSIRTHGVRDGVQLDRLEERDTLKHCGLQTLAAALAIIALVTIIIGQLIALAHAQSGLKASALQVRWCSPFFQPQAHAVLDTCHLSPVVPSQSQGIGCIELPAIQQKTWLLMTTIMLWLTLFCQFADFCFLFFNDKKSKGCHETVKLQRPWLTMFFGMIILIVLAMKGTEYANHLPDGIGERILVFRYDPSLVSHSVCEAHLKSPGLRGGIMGYCDGLFSSWGNWYLGKNTRMEP